jgi:spoIIIJ-associated protein
MEPQPQNPPSPEMERYVPVLESFLRELLRHSGLELTFTINRGQPAEDSAPETALVVDLSGTDAGLLLEKNGALLDALEYLALKAVRADEERLGRISFDCQDWRWLRAQELRLAAQVAAERVMETGDPFSLNPMSARERRIVHLALKDQPRVRTLSEGFGPNRKVVIHPAESARSR